MLPSRHSGALPRPSAPVCPHQSPAVKADFDAQTGVSAALALACRAAWKMLAAVLLASLYASRW